ncbi:MAG: photosystem II reaction center protein PsbN [Verrucomicrobiales bacterium]|nr:photosystem II reaction center protein PsbN [Verrucomicrobiales bacterium]
MLVFIIVGLLLFIMGYGLWLTVGPGKEELRDPIAEHARMHELGIAHGHSSKK